jgi:Cu+-exporting ATPase
VLIIACPCALGSGDADVDHDGDRARRAGRRPVKEAEALERMAKVDTVIVDKTGTLTEGRPKLTGVSRRPAQGRDRALASPRRWRSGSEHPLAEAIVAGAEERGVKPGSATGFEALTGKGVKGKVGGKAVALGNGAMMEAEGIDADAAPNRPTNCAARARP